VRFLRVRVEGDPPAGVEDRCQTLEPRDRAILHTGRAGEPRGRRRGRRDRGARERRSSAAVRRRSSIVACAISAVICPIIAAPLAVGEFDVRDATSEAGGAASGELLISALIFVRGPLGTAIIAL
jgi:hypothetical protein